MLKKLLKYDIKNIYKFLSIFYILCIFFALCVRLVSNINTTTITEIIYQILLGCLFSMIANIIINNTMRIWIRFKEMFYGDESYLIHTLPIENKTLYTSKFIMSIITLFTSFIVIFISLFIAFYTKGFFINIIDKLENILNLYSINSILLLIGLIIILFLEIFSCIECGYYGIIIGNKYNNHRDGYSVLFGFITYIIRQLLLLVLIYIIGIFCSDIMSIFISNTISGNAIKLIIIISIAFYIITSIIIKKICEKSLNNGFNIN